MSELLSKASNGIYSIEKAQSDGRYVICDNETGELIRMPQMTVLQELNRPTPSKRLPKLKTKDVDPE